jgi:hypothetical protein
MLLDEAGYLFKAAANPNATHMGQLVPTLLKLFTSSGELVNLSSYTDSQKNADIDQPNLSIYATGTPDGFWENLNTSNISDGLMGRMLVIPGRGYQQVREAEWIDLPESMIDAAKWWWKWMPGEAADHMLSPAPVKLHRSKAAYDRFWQYFRDIASRRIGEDLTRAAIWSRAPEKANKLALIHCASRHVCQEPKSIEFEDIDWAIRVVNYLTRQLITGCERYVSRNQQEQTVKRVLRIIGDSGQKGLSQDDLSHKLQWLPRKTRLELIADLVESGQVQAARIETGGRPKCKYRLSTHPSKGNPH